MAVQHRIVIAALFGAGLCVSAAPAAVAAAAVSPLDTARIIVSGETPTAFSQARGFKGGGFRGRRGAYGGGFRGRRGFGGPAYGYRRGYGGRGYRYGGGGAAIGAGVAGLAAGAILGSALAAQAQPAPVYAGVSPNAIAYCSQKYRSFDPASGTYLGFDGQRHACQ